VGIVDLEMDWNLQSWMRRMAAGSRSLRVEFGVYTQHLDRAIQIGLRTGQRINELLTVGPYKVITDGSLNTRTAFCYDQYPGLRGDPHPHGLLTVPPAQLLPLMRRAVAAGLDPAVHAIGDQASTLALDAFEALGSGGRLEHAQLLADEDVPRFARLGVTASVQPEHAMDDRDMADTFWAGRTGRSFALRSLLEAGAQLALGSDAPVAPLDPWVTVAAAVGRSRDGRVPWHPEQSITSEAALGASTRTTISVGQPADLAILDENPHTATHGTLRTMPVAATLLAGNFTHRQV
ncbi:MAG: amidohydrolase, partial [Homoserinimonas sp.]|nr:amidohydrolase [Homoserinimonas sp.]